MERKPRAAKPAEAEHADHSRADAVCHISHVCSVLSRRLQHAACHLALGYGQWTRLPSHLLEPKSWPDRCTPLATDRSCLPRSCLPRSCLPPLATDPTMPAAPTRSSGHGWARYGRAACRARFLRAVVLPSVDSIGAAASFFLDRRQGGTTKLGHACYLHDI